MYIYIYIYIYMYVQCMLERPSLEVDQGTVTRQMGYVRAQTEMYTHYSSANIISSVASGAVAVLQSLMDKFIASASRSVVEQFVIFE